MLRCYLIFEQNLIGVPFSSRYCKQINLLPFLNIKLCKIRTYVSCLVLFVKFFVRKQIFLVKNEFKIKSEVMQTATKS